MKLSPVVCLFAPSVAIAVIDIGIGGGDTSVMAAEATESTTTTTVDVSRDGGGGGGGGEEGNIFASASSTHLRVRNEIQPAYCYGVGDYSCYK